MLVAQDTEYPISLVYNLPYIPIYTCSNIS